MTNHRLDSTRPVVVCLHSSGASSRQWHALQRRLEDRLDVVAPDLHGHGDGPDWHGDARGILAADCARVARIAARHAYGVHLVGHSYGAAVALRTAIEQPRIVRSIVAYEPVLFRLLRDFGARSPLAAEVAGVGAAVRREMRAGLARSAAQRFVDYWSGRDGYASMPPERQAAVDARMGCVADHFVALWNDSADLAAFARLDVPVTLMLGARTRAPMRRLVERLRFALPDMRFVELAGLDHTGPILHADRVAQRIEAELVEREAATAAVGRLAA
jgi:pimeloyl-ACP methyl ester carboxylesterase